MKKHNPIFTLAATILVLAHSTLALGAIDREAFLSQLELDKIDLGTRIEALPKGRIELGSINANYQVWLKLTDNIAAEIQKNPQSKVAEMLEKQANNRKATLLRLLDTFTTGVIVEQNHQKAIAEKGEKKVAEAAIFKEQADLIVAERSRKMAELKKLIGSREIYRARYEDLLNKESDIDQEAHNQGLPARVVARDMESADKERESLTRTISEDAAAEAKEIAEEKQPINCELKHWARLKHSEWMIANIVCVPTTLPTKELYNLYPRGSAISDPAMKKILVEFNVSIPLGTKNPKPRPVVLYIKEAQYPALVLSQADYDSLTNMPLPEMALYSHSNRREHDHYKPDFQDEVQENSSYYFIYAFNVPIESDLADARLEVRDVSGFGTAIFSLQQLSSVTQDGIGLPIERLAVIYDAISAYFAGGTLRDGSIAPRSHLLELIHLTEQYLYSSKLAHANLEALLSAKLEKADKLGELRRPGKEYTNDYLPAEKMVWKDYNKLYQLLSVTI